MTKREREASKRITRKSFPERKDTVKEKGRRGFGAWIKLSCREEEKSKKKTHTFDRQERKTSSGRE